MLGCIYLNRSPLKDRRTNRVRSLARLAPVPAGTQLNLSGLLKNVGTPMASSNSPVSSLSKTSKPVPFTKSQSRSITGRTILVSCCFRAMRSLSWSRSVGRISGLCGSTLKLWQRCQEFARFQALACKRQGNPASYFHAMRSELWYCRVPFNSLRTLLIITSIGQQKPEEISDLVLQHSTGGCLPPHIQRPIARQLCDHQFWGGSGELREQPRNPSTGAPDHRSGSGRKVTPILLCDECIRFIHHGSRPPFCLYRPRDVRSGFSTFRLRGAAQEGLRSGSRQRP